MQKLYFLISLFSSFFCFLWSYFTTMYLNVSRWENRITVFRFYTGILLRCVWVLQNSLNKGKFFKLEITGGSYICSKQCNWLWVTLCNSGGTYVKSCSWEGRMFSTDTNQGLPGWGAALPEQGLSILTDSRLGLSQHYTLAAVGQKLPALYEAEPSQGTVISPSLFGTQMTTSNYCVQL